MQNFFKNFYIKTFINLLFFILFSNILLGDTVYLKDGQKIEGKITNQSQTKIEIEVNGKKQIIEKIEINKIEFQDIEALKRKQEEERKKQEELKRKQEEERKKQEELKRKQEEEQKKQEELKRKQEEERKKQEERKMQEKIKKIPPNEIKFIYLRSALLPGWGHYKIGSNYQPYIWGGLFWGSLIATVYKANQAKLLQKEYDNFSTTQYFLKQPGLTTPELNIYYLNETNAKKTLVKQAVNQTTQLSIFTIFVYFIQFYFLYDDIKKLSFQNNINLQKSNYAFSFIDNGNEKLLEIENTTMLFQKSITLTSLNKDPVLIAFKKEF
jgi:sRNA-binding regulator protein Hfq